MGIVTRRRTAAASQVSRRGFRVRARQDSNLIPSGSVERRILVCLHGSHARARALGPSKQGQSPGSAPALREGGRGFESRRRPKRILRQPKTGERRDRERADPTTADGACDLPPHDVAWAGRAPSRPGRPQSERAVAGTPVCPPEKATVTPRACGLLVALPQVHRAPCLRVVVLAQFADGALLGGVGSVAPLAGWTTRSHGCSPAVLGRPRHSRSAGASMSTTRVPPGPGC